MNTAFVLVDGPVEGDFRLLRSIEALAGPVEVIDISRGPATDKPSRLRLAAGVALLVLRGLAASVPRMRKIVAAVGKPNMGRPLAGLPACLRWLGLALAASHELRRRPGLAEAAVIHAHDLYCGVAALAADPPPTARLVYDSHEFQIHRNRAAGLLRILIEAGLEQAVLRRADELHVVNNAIAGVMHDLYDMPAEVRISLNDFYAHHPSCVPPAKGLPALVYVGKGLLGRCLEMLDRPPQVLGFEVFTYFLGSPLPGHIDGSHWHQGPVAYQQPLLQLVRSRRCLMWCCLSTSSLSYRLATPNKLFQALAMGIPVVASRGTYLAELVERYGIGAVVGEGDLAEIARKVQGPDYAEWVRHVDDFRARLRDGSVVI